MLQPKYKPILMNVAMVAEPAEPKHFQNQKIFFQVKKEQEGHH